MLKGEKILLTGPAGLIGYGLAESLAAENDVWGISRFADPAEEARVRDLGVRTHKVDLGDPDFSELPRDFTYLVHVAVTVEPRDYDRALRINAEGTGRLLSHCRNVKAALVMSSLSVYKPNPDPWHRFVETDPLGDTQGGAATYSVSKIAQEAVARYCAREFNIPVTLARMGAAFSDRGGFPITHLKAVAAGEAVVTRWDPCTYSPIHQDDINAQLAPMLAAASVPATLINWCGNDTVSVQQWAAYAGELLGKTPHIDVRPMEGASHGTAGDTTRMHDVTGPCTVDWKEGFRRACATLLPATAI